MKYFIYIIITFLFGCGYIFENDSPEITDIDNDGYDDRDYLFLQKLIDNSQGYGIAPVDTLNPLDIGDQIWVEGRLRSLKHTGNLGGFYLYGAIPIEIKEVEFLNKLVFTDNFFTSIPEEIQELKNLSEIILNDNRFSGEVPEELWLNKNNLKNLSIHNNNFTSVPESVCEVYGEITNFILSHNNLCDIPQCIQNAGIQSCECYDYIEMDICLDMDLDISCKNTIGNILETCPLRNFWGDTLFTELSSLDPSLCVDWEEGTCDSVKVVNDEIEYNPELSNGCFDCDGNPCDDKLPWIGDGSCDEDGDVNFSCPEFFCDMNDCGEYDTVTNQCDCQRDCVGNCIDNVVCYIYFGQYGYDCCIDNGTCEDLTGDGFIQDGIGDGRCDDGSTGPLVFSCEEVWNDTNENEVWDEEENGFNFNCDGGDCGFWNPETGQCEPAPGQIIQYLDDEFYLETH